MAFNLNKISKTFQRTAQLTVFSETGAPLKCAIKCTFQRTTKDEAKQFETDLNIAETLDERSALIEARLEEVWLGWDVIDDMGPLAFTPENRQRLYNELAGALPNIYKTYVSGVMGVDRKND
jgi:hypothetical protein